VPHAAPCNQKLATWLISVLMTDLMRTFRNTGNDRGGMIQNDTDEPAIFAIWHNRLALCMEAYDVYSRGRNGAGLAAMVSASKDGGFLAEILERFRVQPVRGSSSRRGPQALLELTTWAERGYDIAITPDGPRGPCYLVQDGVMVLAQLTGLRIIPVSYNVQWKIRLKSWDRFQIPIPFSKCEMNSGAPIRVPRNATDEERAVLRQQLEDSLKAMTRD
ncbi:MAG: lysophospholipid acyltransferase family protein, partial [Verrucomicrobiota bacterium]